MAFTLTELSMIAGLLVNVGILINHAVKTERRFTTLEVNMTSLMKTDEERRVEERRHHARN